jgi:CheY-like chemotaxis protein
MTKNWARLRGESIALLRRAPTAFDKKIQIRVDAPEAMPVMGDHSGLNQIIMNLCTNARDAMPDGGELRIEARQKGERVEVIISDTGHGMDKETLGKCFDPFFTTKSVDKGTGLGLSTAYGIAKEHGGDMYAYSELGKGTTFKIYFPAAVAPEKSDREQRQVIASGKGQKILIVDDEIDLLKPMEEMLENLGYCVSSAGNGAEALVKYISWRPDAVLLDRNMPEIDGISCAKKIIEEDPAARIILISGYDERGPNGIDAGSKEFIKGYLTKPMDITELSQLLIRLFSLP